MKKLLLSALLAQVIAAGTNAQTVFTYGGTPVSQAEFLKGYQKNTATQKVDYSEKALKEYVDLYALFKMKVKEAYDQKIDTSASVAAEIDNYRRQLAKNFLTDDEVVSRLVKEAYERSKEEVRISHILLIIRPGVDTIAARKTIDSLYSLAAQNKANFAELAKAFSEDKGSAQAGGDMGYITALQTVYSFENQAYNTPVGKVSEPFRSPFGYHILKVTDKRPARGEVKVAQILVKSPKSAGEAGLANARLKIDTIQKELKKGVPFEELVARYSEDKFSKDQKGILPVFGVGRMVPAIDEAAFSLKKPGDISKPVETDYGIHIFKLLEKYPLKPFDSVSKELKSKIANDSRAQQARDMFFEKVKISNGFKEYPKSFDNILAQSANIKDTGDDAATITTKAFANGMKNKLFSLAGTDYTQEDFINFCIATTRGRVMGDKQNVMRDLYKMYQNKVVNDFQEHKLVDENPEYRSLLQEYKDGIMLFELMDRNVWSKASKDSVGLKAFYETKKSDYLWSPGFVGAVFSFRDENSMKAGMKILSRKGITSAEAIKIMNEEKLGESASVQTGHFEFDKFKDVPAGKISQGKPSEAIQKGNLYIVVFADQVLNQPSSKTFEEARGYAISAYQDKLEKDWNSTLKAKYPVQVNNDILKKMVK